MASEDNNWCGIDLDGLCLQLAEPPKQIENGGYSPRGRAIDAPSGSDDIDDIEEPPRRPRSVSRERRAASRSPERSQKGKKNKETKQKADPPPKKKSSLSLPFNLSGLSSDKRKSKTTTQKVETEKQKKEAETDCESDGSVLTRVANRTIQADVFMISGCDDSQTSADVSNVSSFSLPNPKGRAGGACTSALLKGK